MTRARVLSALAVVATAAVIAAALLAAPRAAPPRLRTKSGLAHELIQEGVSDERAAPHDRVRVIYVGYDEQGREIDNSRGRGRPAELSASEGFPGFREALQLLKKGEKRRFFIPEELAYKHYPGSVRGALVYEIELLEIIRMPAPPEVPEDLASPPEPDASGIASRVVMRGMGTHRAHGESTGVDVHYTCWNQRGERVMSTIPSGQPYRAELGKLELMPGMATALRAMVIGERRRLWLTAGQTSHASGSVKLPPLVCDVELRAIYENKRLIEAAP